MAIMQDYIICNLKEKSNMERKYIFFDIDGTLLELGKKEMHQELVDALNLVK